MDKQLQFSKIDSGSTWGFRLVGGADFNQPLLVVKVNENSLAEQCGLQVGDLILRINDCSTAKLTHSEVHELITSLGSDFTLGIRRGLVPIDIIHEDGVSQEFQDILKGIQVSAKEDIREEAAYIVAKLNEENLKRNRLTEQSPVCREKKMVFSNATQTSLEEEEVARKFSTFMMKPDNPMPKPKDEKRNEGEVEPEQDTYKVMIERQVSGRKFFKGKKVHFDRNVTEMEIEARSETPGDTNLDEFEDSNEDTNIVQSTDEINDDFEKNDKEVEPQEEYTNDTEHEIADYAEKDEIKVEGFPENTMTLEEQLLAVQKQLLALSQLPSAIQMTLDAVSKQLASIVSARESSQERDSRGLTDGISNGGEDDCEEGCSDELSEDEARAEPTEDQNGECDSSLDEDFDQDSIDEEEIKAILDRARIEEEEEEAKVEQDRVDISEEEELAQIKETEMLVKREKAMMGRLEGKPKPIQRPIILPGGRKWSNPEDAIPAFRKPKMSEQKIIETIESSLETIAGKRKGINFLKYQPPPKNLDYLERSEVYRLVHNMEPPVRGIVSRPEKVIPEQDYYEASKGAP